MGGWGDGGVVGGYGFLLRSEFFFRTTQELEYFFYKLLTRASAFYSHWNSIESWIETNTLPLCKQLYNVPTYF